MEVLNFDNYDIRTTEYSGQTWYSVVDVMGAMSNSSNPGAYWRNLKKRLAAEGNQSVSNCYGLKLEAADGKYYKTDCADRETVLRLIQSVPSPNAEPFLDYCLHIIVASVGQMTEYRFTTYDISRDKGLSTEDLKN